MPYNAQQVANTMNIFGVGGNDAKKIIDGSNGVNQTRVYDSAQRSADKNFQKALSSSMGELAPLAYQLYGISQANSAWSAQQAQDLRNWQQSMLRYQMDFNASEAAKNRDWQQMMSNTAHQREVKDLLAAGLNPVLSATGGNGAAVTSGATASAALPSGAMGTADTSANSSIVGLLGSMLSAQTQLASTAMSAANNLAITEKNNSTSRDIASFNNEVSERIAKMYVDQGYYSSMMSYFASKYGSDQSRAASAYAAWLGNEAAHYSAELSNEAAHYTADTGYDKAKNFPSTWPGILAAFMNSTSSNGDTPYDALVVTPILKNGITQLRDYYINNGLPQAEAERRAHNYVMEEYKKALSNF